MPTTSPSTTFRPFNRLTWEAAEPPSVEARGITSKEAHVATHSETITLQTVEMDGLPPAINVDEIVEASIQAAFGAIAENLSGYGYPVSGDFGPDEVFALERVFGLFVHAMAVNNPEIASGAWLYIGADNADECVSVDVEAMEPDAIRRDRGVRVRVVGRGTMGEAVRLTGTRAKVAALLADGWGEDADWLRATMDGATTVCPDCGQPICPTCGQPTAD